MDDQPLDLRKDNAPKSTETEHHPPENSPEVEKKVNRLNPNTMALSPEENISRTGGNSDWAFKKKNKKSVHQANNEKEVVRSRKIRTESIGKKKIGSRTVFEANLVAKRLSTFESSFNTESNNNRNRLPVGDCSETTTQELISSIPSTSAGPSLSSKCPISENIPTNINRQSRFMCKLCDKPFKNRKYLNAHSITHSTERLFQCENCKKTFKRKNYLTIHKRSHTGERPFICSVCRKTFTTASNLSAHEKIHTGEKPFQCENCKKKFRAKKHLKVHARLHTGERPSVCSVCLKTFTDPAGLSTHTRIHTGDKPYVCRTCGKAFNQSSNKKRHEKTCKGLLKSHERN